MSIATKTGDHGSTQIAQNISISKTSPQIIALGTIDELSAALGICRASLQDSPESELIHTIQKDLIHFMGELAMPESPSPDKLPHPPELDPKRLQKIENTITHIESSGINFAKWALPGETLPSAHIHLARTIARRAERDTLIMHETSRPVPLLTRQYLNRISDLLWLLAQKIASSDNS